MSVVMTDKTGKPAETTTASAANNSVSNSAASTTTIASASTAATKPASAPASASASAPLSGSDLKEELDYYLETDFHQTLRVIQTSLLELQKIYVEHLRINANNAHAAILGMQPVPNFVRKSKSILDDVLAYIGRLEQNINHANEGNIENGTDGCCSQNSTEGNCKELAGYSLDVDFIIYETNTAAGKHAIRPYHRALKVPAAPATITSQENNPAKVFDDAVIGFQAAMYSMKFHLEVMRDYHIPALRTAIAKTFEGRNRPLPNESLWKIQQDAFAFLRSKGTQITPQIYDSVNRGMEIQRIEDNIYRAALTRLRYFVDLAIGKLGLNRFANEKQVEEKLYKRFARFATLKKEIERAPSLPGGAAVPRTFTITKLAPAPARGNRTKVNLDSEFDDFSDDAAPSMIATTAASATTATVSTMTTAATTPTTIPMLTFSNSAVSVSTTGTGANSKPIATTTTASSITVRVARPAPEPPSSSNIAASVSIATTLVHQTAAGRSSITNGGPTKK